MAGNGTRPDQQNGPRKKDAVQCERTYVAVRCSRGATARLRPGPSPSASATSTASAPASASSPPDAPCRHRRKSAVRRPVTLGKPRPMDQRSGNAYVETASLARGSRGRREKADERRRRDDVGPVVWIDENEDDDDADDADDDDDDDDDDAGAGGETAGSSDKSLPLIDFAAVGEEIMMRPLRPAPTADGPDDEFPAYVPWKATAFPAGVTGAMVTRRSTAACKRCRCAACRRHGRPAVHACLPCVAKTTARCSVYRPAAAAAVVGPNANPPQPRRPSSSCVVKWGRVLLRLFSPCAYARRRPSEPASGCPDACFGNADVAGCKCVDRDALTVLMNRERRRRHDGQRRQHRASDGTVNTTTTTTTTAGSYNNSTSTADSSSNTTNAPSSFSAAAAAAAAATTDDAKDAKAAAHDDAVIAVANTAGGIKSKLRPYRNYKHDTD